MPTFHELFSTGKPVIACIHLPALPGAPTYDGNMTSIYEQALEEAAIFERQGVDALIIENFRDKPFYPNRVPPETIASIAAVSREIANAVSMPIGINVLRNDAYAAMAIATAIKAQFIRVNIHMNAVVSEQGIIQGESHNTLRLRQHLKSNVLIFADVGVKHAAPLACRGLAIETKDLCDRGLADAIIVSGELTGAETNISDLEIVKQHSTVPVLIGSGITPDNLRSFAQADGFIVGSYFKKNGYANNSIAEERVEKLLASASRRQGTEASTSRHFMGPVQEPPNCLI
jgi:hypothetical protein